jgi:hypothetical protein
VWERCGDSEGDGRSASPYAMLFLAALRSAVLGLGVDWLVGGISYLVVRLDV